MNVLSLFAGIGGLDLGLERAGMSVVGQVEIDPFCQRVLAKHWPGVPRHDDVRTCLDWWGGSGSRPAVHLVAGGPPCQSATRAGRRLGMADARWGWPWFLGVVRGVRPQYVVVENSADLLDLDGGVPFGWILGELATLGFDAEWSVLSACAVGAPHMRARLFMVAYANGVDGPAGLGPGAGWPVLTGGGGPGPWTDPVDGLVEAASRSGRVADGVPDELEPSRVRALGNAVVPQIAERVGRLVLAMDRAAVAS